MAGSSGPRIDEKSLLCSDNNSLKQTDHPRKQHYGMVKAVLVSCLGASQLFLYAGDFVTYVGDLAGLQFK